MAYPCFLLLYTLLDRNKWTGKRRSPFYEIGLKHPQLMRKTTVVQDFLSLIHRSPGEKNIKDGKVIPGCARSARTGNLTPAQSQCSSARCSFLPPFLEEEEEARKGPEDKQNDWHGSKWLSHKAETNSWLKQGKATRITCWINALWNAFWYLSI